MKKAEMVAKGGGGREERMAAIDKACGDGIFCTRQILTNYQTLTWRLYVSSEMAGVGKR